MKTRTKLLGWSALFILVAVMFIPSIISRTADAQPEAEPANCLSASPTS